MCMQRVQHDPAGVDGPRQSSQTASRSVALRRICWRRVACWPLAAAAADGSNECPLIHASHRYSPVNLSLELASIFLINAFSRTRLLDRVETLRERDVRENQRLHDTTATHNAPAPQLQQLVKRFWSDSVLLLRRLFLCCLTRRLCSCGCSRKPYCPGSN